MVPPVIFTSLRSWESSIVTSTSRQPSKFWTLISNSKANVQTTLVFRSQPWVKRMPVCSLVKSRPKWSRITQLCSRMRRLAVTRSLWKQSTKSAKISGHKPSLCRHCRSSVVPSQQVLTKVAKASNKFPLGANSSLITNVTWKLKVVRYKTSSSTTTTNWTSQLTSTNRTDLNLIKPGKRHSSTMSRCNRSTVATLKTCLTRLDLVLIRERSRSPRGSSLIQLVD